jgi:hypothetical protein
VELTEIERALVDLATAANAALSREIAALQEKMNSNSMRALTLISKRLKDEGIDLPPHMMRFDGSSIIDIRIQDVPAAEEAPADVPTDVPVDGPIDAPADEAA